MGGGLANLVSSTDYQLLYNLLDLCATVEKETDAATAFFSCYFVESFWFFCTNCSPCDNYIAMAADPEMEAVTNIHQPLSHKADTNPDSFRYSLVLNYHHGRGEGNQGE